MWVLLPSHTFRQLGGDSHYAHPRNHSALPLVFGLIGCLPFQLTSTLDCWSETKRVYIDAHEWSDVVDYRKTYLRKLEAAEYTHAPHLPTSDEPPQEPSDCSRFPQQEYFVDDGANPNWWSQRATVDVETSAGTWGWFSRTWSRTISINIIQDWNDAAIMSGHL